MDKIHNLYITSQTNKNGNTNFNYNLYFSHYGIQIQPDEEAYLNINSFQTLNTFYNINSYSKTFKLKVITSFDVTFTTVYNLEEGNYNIQEFQDMINQVCSTNLDISYNAKKNKWQYTNKVPTVELFIMPTKYNYKYFGLLPDVWTQIPIIGGLLSNQINMNNFSLIVIKVFGLVEPIKSIDNFNSSITRGDVSAIINRQDTSVNALINWVDINNSFTKKIHNTELNQMTFSFYNEYNQLLEDLDDWLIIIKITIKKKLYLQ